jgi:hypothetical protein
MEVDIDLLESPASGSKDAGNFNSQERSFRDVVVEKKSSILLEVKI